MYIRHKTIKGRVYAFEVESYRQGDKVRHRTKSLGFVCSAEDWPKHDPARVGTTAINPIQLQTLEDLEPGDLIRAQIKGELQFGVLIKWPGAKYASTHAGVAHLFDGIELIKKGFLSEDVAKLFDKELMVQVCQILEHRGGDWTWDCGCGHFLDPPTHEKYKGWNIQIEPSKFFDGDWFYRIRKQGEWWDSEEGLSSLGREAALVEVRATIDYIESILAQLNPENWQLPAVGTTKNGPRIGDLLEANLFIGGGVRRIAVEIIQGTTQVDDGHGNIVRVPYDRPGRVTLRYQWNGREFETETSLAVLVA